MWVVIVLEMGNSGREGSDSSKGGVIGGSGGEVA